MLVCFVAGVAGPPARIAAQGPATVLVVTDVKELARRNGLGEDEVRSMMDSIGERLEVGGGGDPISRVQTQLASKPEGHYSAVQILGGDGVVPYGEVKNHAFDAGETLFDPSILTDDVYGDTNNDSFAEIVVARMPDNMLKEDGAVDSFLADAYSSVRRTAIPETSQAFTTSTNWDSAREPMKVIVETMPGRPKALNSPPLTSPKKKAKLDPSVGYLCVLLHGNCSDTSQWWGDDGGWGIFRQQPVAIQVDQASATGVVLTGACWGGWLAERKYAKEQDRSWVVWPVWQNDEPIYLDRSSAAKAVRASNSMGLAYLRSGAVCFVGSTTVDNTGYGTEADGSKDWNYYYTMFATSFYQNRQKDDPLGAFRAGKESLRVHAVDSGDVCSDKLAHAFTYYGFVPIKYWKSPPIAASSATSIVFDISTSMDEMSVGRTKIEAARGAGRTVLDIVSNTSSASKVGVATFSDGGESVVAPTKDKGALERAIDGLTTHGNTDMLAGIQAGVAQLDAVKGVDDKALIFLSDGMDTAFNSRESIVDAARGAGAKGIRIYTIGFGDQGMLDEPLLQQIADETGGTYGFADGTVVMDLVAKMAKAQVVRSGAVPLFETQGTVGQGQTISAGKAVVPDSHGNLETVLAWPGSELELVLKDPSGSLVASGYPGVSVVVTERTAQVRVEGAAPGEWSIEVFGKSTSMPEEPYYALAAFKETSATPSPATGTGSSSPPTDSTGVFLFIILLVFGGAISYVLVGRRAAGGGERPSIEEDESGSRAELPRFALIDATGRRFPLHLGANTVGRSSDGDVIIDDASVSREHAVIEVDGGAVAVHDLGSTAGTRRNGTPILSGRLRPGDRVEFAEAAFTLEPAERNRLDTGGSST